MSNVRFISDLHFGHTRLITDLRGFANREEHDDLIISNWNRVVTKKDTTWILGDITMENPFYDILDRLNGIKNVVGGNHDLPKHTREVLRHVNKYCGCLDYKGFHVSHVPIHPNEICNTSKKKNFYIGNIHGHIHEGYVQDSGGNCDVRYINVSAEAVNYTPVLFTDIVKYLEYVSFKKMNISFNEFLTKVEILRLLNQ